MWKWFPTEGERIFVTASGRFGRAFTDTIQHRDLICILLGCSVPMLLRPAGQHFEVVGWTYVGGIMLGEAMMALENGKFQVQDFELN